MPMPDLDLSFVDQTVADIGRGPETVIPILQAIQDHYRYLPREALERICELTEITPASITGVSTFFTHFRHEPVGQHIIHVCNGTACHVKGAERILDALAHHLRLGPGEDTSADGQFTVQEVACVGCCTLAPLFQIENATFGRLTPQTVPAALDAFRHQQDSSQKRPSRAVITPNGATGEIRVGLGSCCMAQGSGQVHDAIERVLSKSGAPAVVKQVGCVGMCHQTPLVELIQSDGQSSLYCHVKPDDAEGIVLAHFRPRNLARRARYAVSRLLDRLHSNEWNGASIAAASTVHESPICAFLGPQKRLATEYCGQIDPLDLDEYLRHDGFVALKQCLSDSSPEKIVDAIRQSGLRGRGGAGFPTHIKWETVRNARQPTKYLICNGDEGDPGAFMDRMILESYPYRVIEGMAIAALAVGASEGIFYIRAEYPLAVQRIREAIRRCDQRKILENGTSGRDFRFHLSVQEGAGAFICGEETALMHSIEGRRGTARLRPPYPAECGLWQRPTLINNVETFALVPWILRHGADQFAALGTDRSKGTKVFALAGKIARGGLIEVPMGVTLREIVEQIGGGIAGGRRFKAVQVGGPSGGCVPAELADTPIDYEALSQVGAIMGSGGLVVLDDSDCMVDIARYFLRFTQNQSCGKCTFCRIGTKRMLEIMDRICTGRGHQDDIQKLEQLAHQVSAGSLCGLGKTAPNPVLSTIRYFRDEYEEHLNGRCPAGKCKDLIAYRVNTRCIGCTLCSQHCPADAIPMTPYRRHVIDLEKCTRCDTCRQICPMDAIQIGPIG
ncbi:MAG: NAD(P)H-dependent oxidoreductase subunit E [Pirellulales bacterium]|nr:NAD(P)H-dependent oxidoreductase subunit E [Pirellulales bacterium]